MTSPAFLSHVSQRFCLKEGSGGQAKAVATGDQDTEMADAPPTMLQGPRSVVQTADLRSETIRKCPI